MPDGPDPLGKRALFWLPVDPAARPAGKRALYSSATAAPEAVRATSSATAADPLLQRGLFSVACSSCGAVSRVGLLGFLSLQLPFGAWLPRREFDRWMTCPACRRRTWTSVTCSR